jgi:hypothetical protein
MVGYFLVTLFAKRALLRVSGAGYGSGDGSGCGGRALQLGEERCVVLPGASAGDVSYAVATRIAFRLE